MCEHRCAQRFRALVTPLADAFHGTARNASTKDDGGDISDTTGSGIHGVSEGVLRVAALNRLHKKFCAPMLVAIVDSCGDRSTPTSTSRNSGKSMKSAEEKGHQATSEAAAAEGGAGAAGTKQQTLDATPLAHMYAHTGQAHLVLKLARKGYAIEGIVPPPSSEAAQQQPWPPLPSVLVKQGFIPQAWQVIHDNPDRGLERGSCSYHVFLFLLVVYVSVQKGSNCIRSVMG